MSFAGFLNFQPTIVLNREEKTLQDSRKWFPQMLLFGEFEWDVFMAIICATRTQRMTTILFKHLLETRQYCKLRQTNKKREQQIIYETKHTFSESIWPNVQEMEEMKS